jgi:hypothetical protein
MRFFSGATAVVGKNALPAEWISGIQKDQQQGRRERGAKAYSFRDVEATSDARTSAGERRISARRGWVDEKTVVFHTC